MRWKSSSDRGYDSAGVATVYNGKVQIKKGSGKLEQVCKRYHPELLPGVVGIGHTRWATHGGVTAINAHPHTDCTGKVAVVHNGIIQNYQQLRTELGRTHKFVSETDTEVIPHLIEEELSEDIPLEEAVRRAVQKLQGSYSIAAISTTDPGKIVGVRKDSPLVIGVNGKQAFIASDALCFLDKSNRVAYPDDNEIIILQSEQVRFLNMNGDEISKQYLSVVWEWGDVSRQGHDFYMLKEIEEESQSIRRALMQDDNLLRETAIDILRARKVIITGSGTSRYASIIGRYLFAKLAGTFCDVIMSSEFHYFADAVDKSTLVIAVSQSGETADTIHSVRIAREHGATIISIVNVSGSSLARLSDRVFYLNCGPEICVAATKSFMAQLTIFYLLGFAMSNRLPEGRQKLEAVSAMVEATLQKAGQGIIEIARRTRNSRDFYYIARGINFAVAGEGALKLKEVSYVHAEGMPAGELKHGTLALIHKDTPVVVICPRDFTFDETLANTAECKARGAFIVGVSDENNILFDEWIQIPPTEEIFYPMLSVAPLQLLAYHAAVLRGKDPDKPRNLAKSVTVK